MQVRFLCVILPPDGLARRVEQERNRLYTAIGSFSGRYLLPHITLFIADLPEACEASTCEAIDQGVIGQHGFTLRYDGITHFPNKRTIYVDPVEKERVAELRRPIIAALKTDERLRGAIRETDHPHLTIAAGLKPAQFTTAWGMLAPLDLSGQGMVAEVVLMKRLLRPGERYVHVRSFPLRS
ncbi:MAG: 2'-5' RNA ligase family protein [Flavobacteriales bacterium]|nr:2'-5' RNA ligase family protein [Flavobacteriales bacterium]